MRPHGFPIVAAFTAAFALTPTVAAFAHEVRKVGQLEVVVGWDVEPAIAGFQNAVGISVDGPGAEDAELEVTVVFGEGEETTDPLPLEPAFDEPISYTATIIPTRPGEYTFEIVGDVGGESFDESFTSGDDTFDSVRNPADLEFPVQDPTRGELAEGLERLSDRVEGSAGTAEVEPSSDTLARWLAVAAVALAVVAIVASRRRTGTGRS